MKKIMVVMLLALSLILGGCGASKDGSVPGKNNAKIVRPQFTQDTYPRVDGSTATIPLSEAVAAELLGFNKEQATEFVKHNKTSAAYTNLINNEADIIFVTEPSEMDLALAKDKGVELEIVPVVREGFVFVVNAQNPIASLTSAQAKAIYQGKITNWKELGGQDVPIIAYQRNPGSGSQTLMEQVVMKDLELMKAPKTVVPSMEGLIDVVTQYNNSEGAIGYSVYYYADTMYNKENLKILAIDGIAPDTNNIYNQTYPFTSAYYAVMKKSEPADSAARKLLSWLLGQEGQQLAEQAGYVAVSGR